MEVSERIIRGLGRGTFAFLARQLSQASLTKLLFGASLVCLGGLGGAGGSWLLGSLGSKRRGAAILSACLPRHRHRKVVGDVLATRFALQLCP